MSLESNIYVVRHGSIENPHDVVYGSLPFPLSELGRNQVKDLSDILKGRDVSFCSIYTSPYLRTRETSQILQEQLLIPTVNITDDLRDIEVGNLEGKPLQILRDVDFDPDKISALGYDIESKSSIIKRLSQGLSLILSENEGKNVIVVSHGDSTRLALYSQEYPNQIPNFDIRDEKYLAPAEAVILKYRDGAFLGFEFIRREITNENNVRRTESA
jgi:2,3-bisphosphoglycerate-dependent phosphoglycerate mutase